MSDRYSEEIAERDRYLAWLTRENGFTPIATGMMTDDRHWYFQDLLLESVWTVWATATGFRD